MTAARAAYVAVLGRQAYQSGDCAKARHYARLAARLYNNARACPCSKRLAVLYDAQGENMGMVWAFGPYHACALWDQTAFIALQGDGVAAWVDQDSNPDDAADRDFAYYQAATGDWRVMSINGYHG